MGGRLGFGGGDSKQSRDQIRTGVSAENADEEEKFGEESIQNWARSGYVWYDYLCCPQDEYGYPDHREDFLRCTYSLPFYIERCKFFIILVPPTPHKDMVGLESVALR